MANSLHPDQMRIVYTLPGMQDVPVRKGIVYKTVGNEALYMDVYSPLHMPATGPLPAVILVHGGSRPEHVEHTRESQPYVSWSQLIAVSGLIAIMFKHRTDNGYTQLPEAGSDVDDLVTYVREHAHEFNIDAGKLAILTFSSGPLLALRTALRGTPEYIRCTAAYYGGMTLMNSKYFHFSADELELVQEYSPVWHLSREDPAKIAPLFIAKAGQDREFLNDSIDEFCAVANARNVPLTFFNHPAGMHGFDILNDDARSREIIKATLAFLHEHLTL